MKTKLVLGMLITCLIASVALGNTLSAPVETYKPSKYSGSAGNAYQLSQAQQQANPEVVTDDATMARLRVAYLVFKGPNVDVLIDGNVANNGGREQRNIPCCEFGFYGHIYLPPGTHTVTVVPTGKGVEDALLSEEVTLEAGHRYTLAVVGQVTDAAFTPLVIDETAALQEVRKDPGQLIMILINNVAGTETLSFAHDGQGPQNIPYLGFVAAPVPVGRVEYLTITTDVGSIYEGPYVAANFEPGGDYLGAFTGRFPGVEEVDNTYAQGYGMSDLNIIDFMKAFSGLGVESEGEGRPVSFDTFVAAVETAGLKEMLETGGPYLVFAPTDEAFAALPEGRLGELMADPEAMAEVLKYHIVEGYYPPGSLPFGQYTTLTTLLGMDLKLRGFTINDKDISHYSATIVSNGVRINPIGRVLLPEQ